MFRRRSGIYDAAAADERSWRIETTGSEGECRWTRLLPSLPEARATTRVCDRNDVEVVVTDAIDDLVRKARNEHASMWEASRSKSPDVWVFANQFDRSNDGVIEVGAQAPAARFIPAHGLGQFG